MKRYSVAMQCIYTQCIDVFPSFQIMNDYSDTDSEKLDIISLSNQWFSLILIEVSQRVANDQVIDKKQVSRNSSFCR